MRIRALVAAILLFVPALAQATTPIFIGPAYEQCHLLCTLEAGRIETRATPKTGVHGLVRLDSIAITPLGAYVDGHYHSMPSKGSAIAIEALPTVSIAIRDGLLLNASFPLEANRSWNVILPSLHSSAGSHKEVAPGRLAASLQARLPVDDHWSAVPWIGIGYGISKSVGTVDIRPDVGNSPELALDGLGIGTNDLYLTSDLVSRPDPSGWEGSFGFESRLHALPHLEHAYGYTLAYRIWAGKQFATGWIAGARLSGFRTVLPGLDLEETSWLIVSPTVARQITPRMRLSGSVETQVPGPGVNVNELQTFEVRLGVESSF